MFHAVRCPRCRSLSRVDGSALGQTVACPHCGVGFEATAEPLAAVRPSKGLDRRRERRDSPDRPASPRGDGIPVVARFAPDAHDPGHERAPPHGLSPALLGLILLPLGIPLLWLAAPLLTGRVPVFSFVAPLAIALSLIGLGLGIGLAHGWAVGTRVKGILALAMLGYFTAGFLYFLKKEWAEAVRARVGPGELRWHRFDPPDGVYSVELPRGERKADDTPLPGWQLSAYRVDLAEVRKRDEPDTIYEVAHGAPPADLAGEAVGDDDWFAAARKAVEEATDGSVTEEVAVSSDGWRRYPGRQYTVALPDNATNRVVRVFRGTGLAFYLAVQDTFVRHDARDAQRFFNSFRVNK